MKKKYIATVALAVLLLLLFLPVFYYIIFYGTNLNYYELHKIVTIEGNKVLLCFAVLGACLSGLVFFFARKIPYTRRSAAIFTAVTLAVGVVLYLINSNISKSIAFYGGWDCGMVGNSARWVRYGDSLGYDNYYMVYSNNIPVTWVLYKLYFLSTSMADYPYNPEFIWIQYQCILVSAAVIFSALTVLVVSHNIGISAIALGFCSLILGLSPWQVVPYTDGCSIAFPILMLFLYSVYRKSNRWSAYILWFLIMLIGYQGGIMKATCYVTLIAIVLVDFCWTVMDDTTMVSKLKKTGFRLLLLVAAFLVATMGKQQMYKELHYQYDPDLEMGWSNYMYMGLNEETTGASSADGFELVQAYAGQPREVRIQKELEGIRQRMQEKGFGGMLFFWLRKQVMNFNDGTFSWYQEGSFHEWEYADITDSKWKEPLRSFYWEEGENYIMFTTISQELWLFVLVGILSEALYFSGSCIIKLKKREYDTDSDSLCISTVMHVIFLGMFLFVMLFEGRARYLYNTVPVFSVMAILGYYKWYQKFWKFIDSRHK